MGIGRRIREQRLKCGITQQELAQRLVVTPAAVGNYESEVSFPKKAVLLRLFDALECTPNVLFGVNENESPSVCLSPREEELLRKFRLLDEHGKSLVETCVQSDGEEIPVAARNGGSNDLKLKKRAGKSISELPDYRGGRR